MAEGAHFLTKGFQALLIKLLLSNDVLLDLKLSLVQFPLHEMKQKRDDQYGQDSGNGQVFGQIVWLYTILHYVQLNKGHT